MTAMPPAAPRKQKRYGAILGNVYDVARFEVTGPDGQTYQRCRIGVLSQLPGVRSTYPEQVTLRGDRVPDTIVAGADVLITVAYASANDPMAKPYVDGIAVQLAA